MGVSTFGEEIALSVGCKCESAALLQAVRINFFHGTIAHMNIAGLALAQAIGEIDEHVNTLGWDTPTRIFALVKAARALAETPALAQSLGQEVIAAAQANPQHLLSIEQDGLPGANTLEELLAQLAWPETVDGVAIATERIVLPDEVEKEMPQTNQVEWVAAHPQRRDMRLIAGVLRDGSRWCVLRARDNAESLTGPDLLPGLTDALSSTLSS